MPSKFKKGSYVNSAEIIVEKKEKILDVIQESLANPYEALAVYEWVMKGEQVLAGCRSGNEESAMVVSPIHSGLDHHSFEFERALNFLARTNPARMKTIEHLETNYRRSMLDMKKQRASAVASLQTRQSLEMDMLTSSKHSKPDLQSMVHQHVAEMDALMAFWQVEIRTLHQRQLVEYRELVSEVVASEGMTSSWTHRERKPRIYARPEIDQLEWISMQPVAVVSDVSRRARLVRLTRMSGDILSALSSPLPFDDSSLIDPEEEECCPRSVVRSAVLLGTEKFKSNQDTELRNRIDMKCPSDCRWPCLGEQIELVGSARISKTRHSNIAHGIGTIYFASQIPTLDDLTNVFNDCELNEIERLFIPRNFKMDLRAPAAGGQETQDMYDKVLSAIRGLCNRIETPWLDEVVLV
jgi:hypothetical protein